MALVLHHREPSRALAPFVSALWLSEGVPPAHAKERVLPGGSASLILNLAEDHIFGYERERPHVSDRRSAVLIAGPRAQFEVIDTACQRLLAGVSLRPAGTALLLGAAAYELTDLDVPLEAIWGREAGWLRERVMSAGPAEAMLAELERCLLERLPREMPPAVVAHALRELERVGGGPRLAELAESCGLSQRRFIEVFRYHTGITPKVYQRLQRFQRAVRRAHGGEVVRWAELAMECGYYDQAHFVHDFRSFSGITPTDYFLRRGVYANHVPLVEAEVNFFQDGMAGNRAQ